MDKTILIIDDSSSLRALARLALEKAGYNVIEACNGRDAADRLNAVQPDLIVCDVNMPEMGGLDFVRHAKTTTLHRFTPIVMLTNARSPASKSAARAAGASAWLDKPFEPRSFVAAVDKLCK